MQTRRLLLLLMQHACDALKRKGGRLCVLCGAQRAATDTRNESEAQHRKRNAERSARPTHLQLPSIDARCQTLVIIITRQEVDETG